MRTRGRLSIDSPSIEPEAFAEEIELVVPYTDAATTRAVLDRAAGMTAGLTARISLVAIHTVPYPAHFACTSSMHSFLVEQLLELASRCALPVDAQIVLARTREDGYRHALKPASTVLIGSCKRLWRTSEERLARSLASDGHKVVLLHIG